jgi:putative transposase
MRKVKGRSARKLFEEFPELKKRYWGKHFWARGYFCVTVGQMTEEMIKNYLEHHFESSPSAHSTGLISDWNASPRPMDFPCTPA